MYWSLNMRNVLVGFWDYGDVSKRVSPVERRRMVKLKGVVLWRVNSRSEFWFERVVEEWFSDEKWVVEGRDGGRGRWRISSGTSHRWWLASFIRIRRRSFVSKL